MNWFSPQVIPSDRDELEPNQEPRMQSRSPMGCQQYELLPLLRWVSLKEAEISKQTQAPYFGIPVF